MHGTLVSSSSDLFRQLGDVCLHLQVDLSNFLALYTIDGARRSLCNKLYIDFLYRSVYLIL
jgi:hypothetical protein